jgi:hypothetical protein
MAAMACADGKERELGEGRYLNRLQELVHDHRHFGASDGVERGDVDPWQQIADWRRAISFLESRPEVDAAQIGIWGTSYAGGHAIVLGATDRRLKAVVAQVPTISGFEQGLRRVAPDGIAALWSDRYNNRPSTKSTFYDET